MARSKDKNQPFLYFDFERRKRAKRILIVFVSCLFVWGGLLSLSHLGPKKVELSSVAEPKSGRLNVEKYADRSAEELKVASLELEAEAKSFADEGDYASAALKYMEAYEIQKSLNQNHSSSLQHSPSREVYLQVEANNAAAEPLFLSSLDIEQQADGLAESGDLDSASRMLMEAIALQKKLNDEYRDTRRSSLLRLKQLNRKLAELESREVHSKIESLLESGKSFEATGELQVAGDFFQKAVTIQKKLNEDFPESPYASVARLAELQKKRQSAQSFIFAEKLEQEVARLDQLLAKRSIDEAKQLIVEVKESLQEFREIFPLSQIVSEDLVAKVNYLENQKAFLSVIQNQVYHALIPVDNTKGIFMLRTEVPQSLYMLLIGTNPSRNKADTNPVDSVSWIEANTFCERLSWVLGKEVRLPTEALFLEVLGDVRALDSKQSVWCVVDSNGNSQPVGQKEPFPNGFYDLLGNVSEWLEPLEDNSSKAAPYIGGHAQDSMATILNIPVRELQKTGRNRLIGFRFIVLDERG